MSDQEREQPNKLKPVYVPGGIGPSPMQGAYAPRRTLDDRKAGRAASMGPLARAVGQNPPSVFVQATAAIWRHLFIKYVHGFDQRASCGKCLLGVYSRLVPFNPHQRPLPARFQASGILDEAPAPFIVVAGVHIDGHAGNVVAAFHVEPEGESVQELPGLTIHTTGMVRFDFGDVPGSEAVHAAYRECPNWRMGWHAFPDLRRPFDGMHEPPAEPRKPAKKDATGPDLPGVDLKRYF